MAATLKIYELSASRAGTDKTSATVRFKLADNATVDLNNPLTIPSSGSYKTKSYSKHIRLYCATAPDTQIDNLRMYTDGTNSICASVDVYASNVGIRFDGNATGAAVQASDLFAFTSAAPMDIDAIHITAVTASGFNGDIIKLQMLVASDATSGAKPSDTITFAYDEI